MELPVQLLQPIATEKSVNEPSLNTSPYNKSVDSTASPMIGENAQNTSQDAVIPIRRFGKKMLSRLVSNWRCVNMFFPEVLRQNNLSPQDLLDDVLNLYCGKHGIPVTEKVFRHILVAETNNRDRCTPEFAEQVLSHTLDLYDAGMEDCFPSTPLWNYVLLSWMEADRKQATSAGVARIVRLMDELKVQRSRQTYRILFRECTQRGNEQAARDAEALLRQMYKEFLSDNFRVQPDMSSFIYVVDAWAKSKSQLAGPRAEQIYEQMKALRSKNHLLDTYTDSNGETRLVTCVVMCYVGAGTASAAEKAEEFCRRTGSLPDTTTYSALINVYAKHSNMDAAERIWSEMTSQENSVGLNMKELEFSASALLNAYSTGNDPNRVERAEALFNRMKDMENVKIDTPCYNGTFNEAILLLDFRYRSTSYNSTLCTSLLESTNDGDEY
jgi:pentatricopeptide repeat protein